jgi:hypothetical protein
VAVPATLAVISFVLGWLTTEPNTNDAWPAPDVPVRTIVLVWAIVTPIAIGGIKWGLQLARGRRTLVLFLRRFGYDDAQSAVTFAVLRTIGSSWRVVTLDDAELAPIGVASTPRRLFQAGHFTSKHVLAIGQFLGPRMFPYLIWAMWGVLALALAPPAIQWARTGRTTFQVWERAIDPFLRILGSVFEGRPPFEAVTLSLPGVFAVVVMAAAVSFLVLIATMAVLLVALPLSPILLFLSSASEAVRDAEKAKTVDLTSSSDVEQAARAIAERSHKVLGPRLVTMRVSTPAWQYAVASLAKLSRLVLIDVSEPTDNVLWEIAYLTEGFGDRCVLIGNYDRVTALAERPSSPVERRLCELLKDREVLAYTGDRSGLRRFATALQALLTTRSLPR